MKKFLTLLLASLGPALAGQVIYTPYHFTTIAGTPGISGSADGPGAVAQFYTPEAVAVDSQGNVYVADSNNNTIRKIVPSTRGGQTTWTVSTLAGQVQNDGVVNGPGPSAEFYNPVGIYAAPTGTLYVSDIAPSDPNQNVGEYNTTVWLRIVAPNGYVSTQGGSDNAAATEFLTLASRTYALDSQITQNQYTVAETAFGNTANLIEYNDLQPIRPGTNLQNGYSIPNYIVGGTRPSGNVDGPPATASLGYQPQGVAVDANDNVYVSDTVSHTIRRATRTVSGGGESWFVTTLAGSPSNPGTADGTGAAARFISPYGLTVDSQGNVYVADSVSNTIRMGVPNHAPVAADGTAAVQLGQSVSFALPATDADGDPLTYALTGFTGGTATVSGNQATFTPAAAGTGLVSFTASDGYATSNVGAVTVSIAPAAPAFTSAAVSQTIATGRSVAFSPAATGFPTPTFQWTLNGSTSIPGALSSTDRILLISGATADDDGSFICTATNSSGNATTAATLHVVSTAAPGYLTDLSGRGIVGSGPANGLFGGFGISGTASKHVLVRGIGPGLSGFAGLTGFLADPLLTLYDSSRNQISQNDNWGGAAALAAAETAVGAFSVPASSLDAMLSVSLAAGSYTAAVTGNAGGTGIALVELYDADPAPPASRLDNVSARAPVGTGNNILIGGFVVGGNSAETVLIRAVGPGLNAFFGLDGTLTQPVLTLYDSHQQVVAANTIWGGDPALTSAANSVGAYILPPDSQDSVLLVTLAPGGYSAEVSGLNGSAGIASVEIYELP